MNYHVDISPVGLGWSSLPGIINPNPLFTHFTLRQTHKKNQKDVENLWKTYISLGIWSGNSGVSSVCVCRRVYHTCQGSVHCTWEHGASNFIILHVDSQIPVDNQIPRTFWIFLRGPSFQDQLLVNYHWRISEHGNSRSTLLRIFQGGLRWRRSSPHVWLPSHDGFDGHISPEDAVKADLLTKAVDVAESQCGIPVGGLVAIFWFFPLILGI